MADGRPSDETRRIAEDALADLTNQYEEVLKKRNEVGKELEAFTQKMGNMKIILKGYGTTGKN